MDKKTLYWTGESKAVWSLWSSRILVKAESIRLEVTIKFPSFLAELNLQSKTQQKMEKLKQELSNDSIQGLKKKRAEKLIHTKELDSSSFLPWRCLATMQQEQDQNNII